MSEVILRAEGVSVRRGGRIVVEPCDVTLHAGEVLGVYGPNGAGKSSLLEALAGLLPLASGRIRLKGPVVGNELSLLTYHRRIAVVFQEPLLLRGTVWHNVALGLRLRGIKATEQKDRVQAWLNRLKIAHLAQRSVRTLSGGEAQRTSLARALVLDPEVLFFDEPFAALDAPTRQRLAGEVAEILSERRIATLFVTHDLAEACELSQRCLILDQGRILQEGDLPNIIQRPVSKRVAEITGAENLLDAVVAEITPEGGWLDWQGLRILAAGSSRPPGSAVTFTIRPEDLHLHDTTDTGLVNPLRGQVEQVRQRHHGCRVTIRVGPAGVLQALCLKATDFSPGQEVLLSVPPQAVWICPQ